MAFQVSRVPDLEFALCFGCVTLALLVPAGLALMNAGLGRSRNAAHALVSALCAFFVAAGIYFLIGYPWQGLPGGASYALTAAGKDWNWIGVGRFAFAGAAFDGTPASTIPLFQLICVGIAAIIPLGAAGGRWRIRASALSAAMLAGWTYPLFAHWVWGGGWLARLGANFGLGRGFLDAGGSAVINVVGGTVGLCAVWILGARRGKYLASGTPNAIPGHNIAMVVLGCFLAIIGWLGLNSAGALLFSAIDPSLLVQVAIDTILNAGFAVLAAAVVTRLRFGKPDASLCMNGCIGGLVAGSAGCAVDSPWAAAVTGLIAGGIIPYAVEFLEIRMSIDDPGGTISVHGICGLWGLLAVGLFDSAPWQILAQLIGIATLLGFVLPLSYGLLWAVNHFWPMRVAWEAERQGLDLHELGAGAYPEFVTHGDEFLGS